MNMYDANSHFRPAASRKTWEGKVEEIIESTALSHHSAPDNLKKKILSLVADICFATDASEANNRVLTEQVKDTPTENKELELLRKFVSDGETLRIVKHPWKGDDYFTLTTPIEMQSMQLVLDLVENGKCKFVKE